MFILTLSTYIIIISNRLDGMGDVKVGDFGLAEDMYSTRESSKTVKLPFKWMPPESLEEGFFSEKSDVVRFYVVSCYIKAQEYWWGKLILLMLVWVQSAFHISKCKWVQSSGM